MISVSKTVSKEMDNGATATKVGIKEVQNDYDLNLHRVLIAYAIDATKLGEGKFLEVDTITVTGSVLTDLSVSALGTLLDNLVP